MARKIRILLAVAFGMALFVDGGVCQSQIDSAGSEIAPLRIVGLQYPRLAHLAVIQGRVELAAVVSTDGAVKEVRTISGHPLLIEAARDSLRQWRFKNCPSSGTQCSAKVTFVFVLEKESCDLDRCPNDIQIDLPNTVTIKSKPARAIIN
jgi:TonB family protein